MPGVYVYDPEGVMPEDRRRALSDELAAYRAAEKTTVLVFLIERPEAYDGIDSILPLYTIASEIFATWDLVHGYEDMSLWDVVFSPDYKGRTILAIIQTDQPVVGLWSDRMSYSSDLDGLLLRIEYQGFRPALERGDAPAAAEEGTAFLIKSFSENWLVRYWKQTLFEGYYFAIVIALVIGLLAVLIALYLFSSRIWGLVTGKRPEDD